MRGSQRYLFGRRHGPGTEAFQQPQDWGCLSVLSVWPPAHCFNGKRAFTLPPRPRVLTCAEAQLAWGSLSLPSDAGSLWRFVKETGSSVVGMGPCQLHRDAVLDACLGLSCTWDSPASPCQLSLSDQCLLSPSNCFGNCRRDGSQLLTAPGTSQSPLAEEPNPKLS